MGKSVRFIITVTFTSIEIDASAFAYSLRCWESDAGPHTCQAHAASLSCILSLKIVFLVFPRILQYKQAIVYVLILLLLNSFHNTDSCASVRALLPCLMPAMLDTFLCPSHPVSELSCPLTSGPALWPGLNGSKPCPSLWPIFYPPPAHSCFFLLFTFYVKVLVKNYSMYLNS